MRDTDTPGRRSRTSCGQEARNFVKRVREITKLAGPAALSFPRQKEDGPEKERGEWRTGERGYFHFGGIRDTIS